MTRESRSEGRTGGGDSGRDGARRIAPGKTTRTQRLPATSRESRVQAPTSAAGGDDGSPPVQLIGDDPFGLHLLADNDVAAVAAAGTSGPGGALPHGEQIQASFGRHDVSDVQAHVGGGAAEAAASIGARAYATGNNVAFADAPDLHTAAHEAAHVVQQRAGVHLYGGVGRAGDRYEQHADAVADAVVRGESAEGVLDEMAGSGGASTPTVVQRQEGGRRSGGGSRASGVKAAAGALLDAVDFAQLQLHSHKAFVDSELVSVERAIEALGDALHTQAGELPPADAKALDKAVSAGYSLANALTIGEHARPKKAHQLRAALAELQHLIDDPRSHEPPRTPAELIPVVADNLDKLRIARSNVVERILDYPSVDLHALDQAITETDGWMKEMAGPGAGGTKAASRLTRAVLDQADVLRQVVPELTAFFSQPLTESSDEVVYGLVLALAHSTKRSDKAQRTATLAVRARRRQRLDEPRSVIEGSTADVAALGELNKAEGREAREQQQYLEKRLAVLDQRAKTGDKVSMLDRDRLLIEAREHDYHTHVRVLELQLRASADGLDGLDDGFTGGINRYSDTIPTLVADLRGIARVAAATPQGYRERVKIVEEQAEDIDDERERFRKIADGKLAALDWMQQHIVDYVDNKRFKERLEAAMVVAEKAQTRLFIANVLTTIAMTLAGNLAASALRGAAEGAYIARVGAAGVDAVEATQAAKTVGTVAQVTTDLVLNSVGQKLALGDKRSFLTILGANAVTTLAVHAVQVHFVKIEHMIDDVKATAGLWKKAGMHGKKFAAALPELSMSMIVGAAVDHAVTRAAGYDTPPGDEEALVSEWMAQGAAMAIGRHITVHSQAFQKLSARLQGGARKWAHARVLAMDVHVRGAEAMHSGDIAKAQAALAELEALMAIERAMAADELEASRPSRRLEDDTLDDVDPVEKARVDAGEAEPLPRTKKDRDPFSRDGLDENAAAIARGEPGYNSVVGTVDGEAAGMALIQRLMRGDAAALAELGYISKGKFDPKSREWGLGKIGNKYVVVAGEHAAVDWSAVAGVEPISHSHPLDVARTKRHAGQRLDIRTMVAKSDAHNLDAALVFSSPGDIQHVAIAGVGRHSLALPYEHLSGTEITLASETPSGRPQLVLVLEDAAYLGVSSDDGAMRFQARATVQAGDDAIWSGTIDAVFPPGADPHLEFNAPSKAGVRTGPAPASAKTKSGTTDGTEGGLARSADPAIGGDAASRPTAADRSAPPLEPAAPSTRPPHPVEDFLATLSPSMAARLRSSGHAAALENSPRVLRFLAQPGEKNVTVMDRFVAKAGLPPAEALPLLERLLTIRPDLTGDQAGAFTDALRGGKLRAAPLVGEDAIRTAIELAATSPYTASPEQAAYDLRSLLDDNVTLPVAFNELLSPSPMGTAKTMRVAGPMSRGPDVRFATEDGTTVGREMYATDMATEPSVSAADAQSDLETRLMRGIRQKAFDYQRPDVPRFTSTEVSVHVRESSKGYNFDKMLHPELFERVMYRMRVNPDTKKHAAEDVLDRVRFYNSRGDLVYEWRRADRMSGAARGGA